MARPRGRERLEIYAKCAFVGRAVGPKSPPCLPIRPQAFVVRNGILNDESFNPFRMRQDTASSGREEARTEEWETTTPQPRFSDFLFVPILVVLAFELLVDFNDVGQRPICLSASLVPLISAYGLSR
jgi:hypothetical protein